MNAPRPLAGPFVQDRTVVALAVSPDGKRLVTVAPDDQTIVWNTTTGQERGRLTTLELFAFVGAETRRRQRGAPQWAHFATFVDNDLLLSWGNDPPPSAGNLPAPFIGACLWNTTNEKPQGRFDAHRCFALAPDGRSLATHIDRSIVLWELATRRRRGEWNIDLPNPEALGFCDAGRTIAIALPEWSVHCLDSTTGQPLRRFDLKLTGPIPQPRNTLLFSPDGEHVIPAGSWDGTLRRWDTRTGREVTPLVIHPRLIHSVIFSPDGSRLAAVGKDKVGAGEVVLVVEAATGKPIHRLPRAATEAGIMSIAFGPDGKTIATGATDGRAFLWPVP